MEDANSFFISTCDAMLTTDATLDITGETCPMTYVRVRLALDRMSSGQTLLVVLAGDDPLRNVPRMARQQGHAVLSDTIDQHGAMRLVLQKR